ncbi:hypothetical protein PPTG_11499 [Phytophthora nicotianae INRA-310]|uniref:Uncharacterized protein n=1 Tax=Phytophthora nicotianae (strain INRA-310) TaxID=761204 RepID=W2QBL3_PHYN3|nr:hypothetical protein PPTG_11499 [Phytophthora nicotianae INRA-310]ETN09934.1 hypothetical protein PPTG_11499 [Phytophthora nicotianae INRA-310]
MNLEGPSLSILSGSDMVSVKLLAPPRLIKVDPINYALQVGSSTADMLLNARELLRQQDTMCVTCRKRRGPLPASVTALLAVPFAPDELVPLLLPHDLRIVRVRRQHILDVCLGPRKKSKLDLYKDPQANSTTRTLLISSILLPTASRPTKFGKFRNVVATHGASGAEDVCKAFARNDEELLGIRDLRQSHRSDDHAAIRRRPTTNATRRNDSSRSRTPVPQDVLAALPVQGTKSLSELPDIVKEYSVKHYNGLVQPGEES